AVAVRSSHEELTYAELAARSGRMANVLLSRGVVPGTFVALALASSINTIATILAVLRCGGAYIPLGLGNPPDRLRTMIADSRPIALIEDDTGESLAPSGVAAVRLGELLRLAETESDSIPHIPVDANHAAYIIYTSGSTGRPKGVVIEHGGLSNLVSGQIAAFGIDACSQVLQFASLGFDAAVSEIFTALCVGGTLRLCARNELVPGLPLITTLRAGVTVATLPPSLLAVLPTEGLDGLTTVISAGEACSDAVVIRWSNNRRFINAYGPTEAS